MNKTFVFDVDDVISTHKDRDYKNAKPNMDIISKMKALKDFGNCSITLYTSRGQKSCGGDLKLIEIKNRAILEEWLAKYKVPYDKLIFGKPLGDIYVDDKAMSLNDFMEAQFTPLYGGSAAEIFRFGNYVKKSCKDAGLQAEWLKEAKELGYNVPKVNSYMYDEMYIDYIKGGNISYTYTFKDVTEMFGLCMSFSAIKNDSYKFDYDEYIEYIMLSDVDEHIKLYVSKAVLIVEGFKSIDIIPSSFCHGDLTTSNIIKEYGSNKLYMIDPIGKKNQSSFVLDLAQVRKSLNGFTGGSECLIAPPDEGALKLYDNLLKLVSLYGFNALNIVKKLEFTLWVRLYKHNYKDVITRNDILAKLACLSEEVVI